MKVKDILELTKTKNISDIAKEHLTIGEKPTRKALKLAGCYSINGQPGWFFDDNEDPDNLEKSIYDYAIQYKQEHDTTLKAMANLATFNETSYVPRKRHSFDLDVRLIKELKLHCVQTDKTLYEVVEEAIRDYLKRDTL